MKKKPTRKPSELTVISIKVHPDELKAIRAKAKENAEGNLSAWIRHSGKEHTLKKGEKVSLKVA